MYRRIFIFFISIFLLIGVFFIYTTAQSPEEKVGEIHSFQEFLNIVPDVSFTKTSADNKSDKKLYLVDFWATWCPPCRAEIPHFIELQTLYQNQLQIVGVSVDSSQSDLKSFLFDHDINYPIVFNNDFKDYLKTTFGDIYAIPTTFLVNGSGEILEKVEGYKDLDYFKQLVDGHL